MAVEAIPGFTRWIIIWKNDVKRLQPSTSAEFSISLGTCAKKFLIIKEEPGKRKAIATIITPNKVFTPFSYINTYTTPIKSSTPGNILRMRRENVSIFFPTNSNLDKA